MNISYNWLQEFIDIELSPEEVADKLTLVGLEVEGWTQSGSRLEGVIVGDVTSVAPHPNADRLQLCQVNLGTETVQIVCGAPNVAAGQKVPVATVGSTLPAGTPDEEPFTIRKAKLRGESSSGMICSQAELGLGDEHEGIWVLDTTASVGTPLHELFGLEQDTIFEIALTPNRPDAACHYGVARDLAALLDTPLKSPTLPDWNLSGDLSDRIPVRIEASERCGRYLGMIIDNVDVKPSPSWLKQRLESIGLRSINNVVDATNYVLHELGQPLHAFDLNAIQGDEVIIRRARKNETIQTLDHQTRKLTTDTLVICDAERPMAIAGIMGGLDSEVTDTTRSIFLESAWFEPTGIRRTSKELTLQTDASYRYERGVDPNLAQRAALRAANLIVELTGGTVHPSLTDLYPTSVEPKEVPLRYERIETILGAKLEHSRIRSILHALEIETTEDGGRLLCTIPTFRPDIEREIDLIEEVGRIHDYNNIPAPETTPHHTPRPLHPWERLHQAARESARRIGYQEITTNSLHSKEVESRFSDPASQIDTLNPVSQVATTLRTNLVAGFLGVCQYNVNRNARSLKLFEVGHTYKKGEEAEWIQGVQEESLLLLGLHGLKREEDWRGEARPWSAFDLKADLQALFANLGIDPTRDLDERAEDSDTLLYLSKDGTEVARLERLSENLLSTFDLEPPTVIAQVRLSKVHHLGLFRNASTYQPFSRYPGIDYDAAYIVPVETAVGDMEQVIRETAGDRLQRLQVFDIFEGSSIGESKKSIAFRLSFLDSNNTLTIKDVEPVVQEFSKKLEQKFGASLRS